MATDTITMSPTEFNAPSTAAPSTGSPESSDTITVSPAQFSALPDSPKASSPVAPSSGPEGFGENFSHVVTGVAHPLDQAGSELQSLTDHPLSTLGAATKQAAKSLLIDLPTALVYHPLDTLKTMTGGTDLRQR